MIWALGYFPRLESLESERGEALVAQHLEEVGTGGTEAFLELPEEQQLQIIAQEQSYIGQIGHAIEPIFAPQHFDWRLSVSTLTGVAAKEMVVSTLGVLYLGDGDEEDTGGLSARLQEATYPDGTKVMTIPVVVSFIVFILLYFPCVATFVAIGKETGSYRWALFDALYTTIVAWLLSALDYYLTALLI